MTASSLSMAANVVAIGISLNSLSSISVEHLSLHLIPRNKASPAAVNCSTKFKTHLNCYSSRSPFFSTVFSASTELGSVELHREEEDDDDDVHSSDPEAGSEEEEHVEPQSVEAGRLYVGNLPYSMTSNELSEIFAEAGRVGSVEIVYDRVTDRSRGFSFVVMGSLEEAKEAIRMFDGAQIGGRTAKVNFPEVPRGGEREVMTSKIQSSYQGFVDSPHKIYAGNLSWALTSQGLREAFQKLPGFISAKVIYHRETGRSRGFGFVTFASEEEGISALNSMNGMEVEGRPLRLNLTEQRAPASPPPAIKDSIESSVKNSEMLSSTST